ncbi:ADP-ribosylglycohydrolase family protein [Lysobacter korlensis]|uniref:ADP-ribosylglycohydrolase family protein n=1 Tax=Lysobacter korlensis TaxID=553636 RepID=A0ABV6RW62_9GAMM
MLRLSWSQPEDLVGHAIAAAEQEGSDVSGHRQRWIDGGGDPEPRASGASPEPAPEQLRTLARELLAELDAIGPPADLTGREPSDLGGILASGGPIPALPPAGDGIADRIHAAWLGRAAGCLLGKPVEKIHRDGIRAIAEATGNWPIRTYFTERGLPARIATAWPWNRRSRPTSLLENIDGMPEDDDLNFPLLALGLVEQRGRGFTTDDVAQAWLNLLPGGRVFTAERIVYRNLLNGHEPDEAALVQNPFREWIGAQIRTDLYGWVHPGDPVAAAKVAWVDARLSHVRSGVYGAMFAAAACAAAVVADDVDAVLDAGLAVVPVQSRYADAVRFGRELGASGAPLDDALDRLYRRYGGLHWVHVLNNAALVAYALAASRGEFGTAISTGVAGGWDTDSNGATLGSISGALTGTAGLPAAWITPLKNRLSSSVPGFDGIGFDELARRTAALAGERDDDARS